MRKIFTLSIMLLSSFMMNNLVSGQNLVPNNGFETQDTCPAVSEILLAPPWNSPTIGTPDLFNSTCGSQNSPARTGIGSSGVYAFSTFANNREYIQAPLTSTLLAGQTYCVSFYISRSNFRYAINRFGAYLSNGAMNLSQTSYINVTPQVENPSGNMLAANGWILISGSFTASGGESHIIIGNFSNDADTDTLVANSGSSSKVAYYKIDDISVTACTVGIDELENMSDLISIFPTPANQFITIKTENGLTFSDYQISSISGELVKTENLGLQTVGLTLDVSDMANGIYVLSLTTPSGLITKKLMVNK